MPNVFAVIYEDKFKSNIEAVLVNEKEANRYCDSRINSYMKIFNGLGVKTNFTVTVQKVDFISMNENLPETTKNPERQIKTGRYKKMFNREELVMLRDSGKTWKVICDIFKITYPTAKNAYIEYKSM